MRTYVFWRRKNRQYVVPFSQRFFCEYRRLKLKRRINDHNNFVDIYMFRIKGFISEVTEIGVEA